MIEVRLNGETTTSRESGEERHLPYLPPDQINVVELLYESYSEPAGMNWTYAAPIPQTNATVLEFRWRFGLSPDLKLGRVPEGTSLVAPMPAAHWTTRFFGPFGRGAAAPFLPWNTESWKRVFALEPSPTSTISPASEDEFFPAGWPLYETRSLAAPNELRLHLWKRDAAERWGWIAVLGSLIAGFVLRIAGYAHRRQVGLIWLLLSLLAAGLLPMPWAMLAGGCVAGTFIAFMFPRRFLVRSQQPADVVPPGSTATFDHRPGMSMLLWGLLGISWLLFAGQRLSPQIFGQEVPSPPTETPPTARGNSAKFDVMIPVKDPRHAEEAATVVYVDRPFLERLKQAQPERPEAETYLISSANYEATVDPQGAVDITATFQVAVLSPRQSVKILLPFENAFLGGPDHCLVDGVPHSVLSDSVGKGYVVELAARRLKPIPLRPAVAEKAGLDGPAKSALETHQIQLNLHGPSLPIAAGGRYALSVPPIAASRLSVQLFRPFSRLDIRGAQGQLLATTSGKTVSAQIGAAEKLEIVWSQQPNEPPRTPNAGAKVTALTTLHPLWDEWQIRVAYRPQSELSSVVWSLPANTILTDVKAEKLLSYRLIGNGKFSRLLLEFQEPPASDFTVDVHCLTPRPPGDVVSLPMLDLFSAQTRQSEADATPAEYQLGVATTPELAVAPAGSTLKAMENLTPITPEKFLAAYRTTAVETLGIRTPRYAWKLGHPAELEFTLQPRTPDRRVWLNQEGRIGERELRWQLTAEIETTTAPAFRHVLQVPADLVIDSLSVLEDETERLVRWTQIGSRVELVLSEGTSGIQNVHLTGHLPIAFEEGDRINLPLIHVEDAELVDSGLRVYQLQSVGRSLRLENSDDLLPWETGEAEALGGDAFLLAAVRLRHDSSAPQLVVEAPLEPMPLDRAVFVEPAPESHSQITSLIRLRETKPARRGLQIQVPAAMTQEFRVEFADQHREIVPYQTTTRPNQSLVLYFEPAVLADRRVLKIVASVEVPSSESWTPPDLEMRGGRVEDSFLILSPELTVRPEGEAGTVIPLAELPGWVKDSLAFGEDADGVKVYHNPTEKLPLIPARLTAGSDLPHQAQLHTTLWLTEPHRLSGQTVLQLPKESAGNLSWHWPKEIKLQAVLIDGIPQTATLDEEHETLTLPQPASGAAGKTERTWELYWSQNLPTGVPRFGKLDLSLPKPLDRSLEEARLTVVPPANVWLIPQRDFQPAPAKEQANIVRFANALEGRLTADGKNWPVSFWLLDSRSETALLLTLLVLIVGGLMHWGLRLETGEWLHRHQAIALGVLGGLWWTCLAGSALGFGLMILAPLLAFTPRFKREEISNTNAR